MIGAEALGGRFDLQEPVATGGMGSIYKAWDREQQVLVAVKVLLQHAIKDIARFDREAEALAELSHPGIVRYVAHGRAPDGAPYLVMEWIDGETLWARIQRKPLSVRDAVVLALRVSEALGEAHRCGLVHRDVKPENILLLGGRADRIKLIDFGIARRVQDARVLTAAGAAVGTPGYMAPEQVKGLRNVDARADVFALGCVLFECLTGRAAFWGENQMAVALKILIENPPRLREIVEVPEVLDDLVARMLAKDVARRPADGDGLTKEITTTLARVLADSGAWRGAPTHTTLPMPPTRFPSATPGPASENEEDSTVPGWADAPAPRTGPGQVRPAPVTEGLGGREQRLFTVVLAAAPEGPEGEAGFAAIEQSLRVAVEPYGGHMAVLEGGSAVVTLSGGGGATDQAERAARCALAMRDLLADARIVVTTGRGVSEGRMPVGEVIDRGVRSLWGVEKGVIRLDAVTADLLQGRFDLGSDAGGSLLRGAIDPFEATRTLLGRPTPFVGREGEAMALEALWARCAAERTTTPALVVGPAGSGKSRLRSELLRSLREGPQPFEVLFGRGDAIVAGSPYSVVAPAIRRSAGILEGEPFEERKRKLRARLGRHLGGDALAHATAFLGEIVGAPVAAGDPEDGPVLAAARTDPVRMADQIRLAFQAWLDAEAAATPVLLLLDDLQWGDRASVSLLGAVIGLRNRPVMVVAFGRPEVEEAFPWIADSAHTTVIRLEALSPDACEAIVRSALGDDAGDAVVARIVERADGNPFFLEEMTRAVAAGSASLPETVLGTVQVRLDALPEASRRVLRAASIFGDTFWPGAVSSVVGGADVGESLKDLGSREMVYARGSDVFPGETDWVFASGLVREAAYASLTEDDRTIGHRLAGEWLERMGESDPIVLAEHFDEGGEPRRAMAYYRRGAEQAIEGNDFALSLARAERAIACGATSETQAGLWLLMARAHEWRGENEDARRCAEEAMSATRGSDAWCDAVSVRAVASGRVGDQATIAKLGGELLVVPWSGGSPRGLANASATVASWLVLVGRHEKARELLDRAEALGAQVAARDPLVRSHIHSARARLARADGELQGCVEHITAAVRGLEEAEDTRSAQIERVNLAYALAEVGAFEQAQGELEDAIAAAEWSRIDFNVVLGRHMLALVLGLRGDLAEARAAAESSLAAVGSNKRVEGKTRIYLARCLSAAGDGEAAEREATAACELLGDFAPGRAYALAILASVRAARGDGIAALAAAREALGALMEAGGVQEGDAYIRLSFVRALTAAGEKEMSSAALADARERILHRAQRITRNDWRESFLQRVPENAATMRMRLA